MPTHLRAAGRPGERLEALEAGLNELKATLLTVGAELVKAEMQGIDLEDVVTDPVRFPHAAQMHGVLGDMLDMDPPAELEPWIRKVVTAGPFPHVADLNKAIARLAVDSPNVSVRALARFGMFELLCLHERLVLRADGVHLELMNGRRRAVEVLAAQELNAACELARASADFLAVDDPLALLAQMATTALARHVDALRLELTLVSEDVHDQLERRKLLIAAAERVGPAERILILNVADDASGEERVSPAQLRRLHPLVLGDMSDDNIYKQVERLPDRVRAAAPVARRTMADVIIEAAREAQE